MQTSDIFTFCQNDLHSKSFAVFEEMKRNGQFCDLTIKVSGHLISAHRIIIAAGIPYFQSAFDCIGSESEEKEIAVEDNLDPTALESLILFAYTSKVNITTQNVQSLLVAAQFLQLVQVRDSCIEFLSKRLNINNFVQVRELAVDLNNYQLIESCNGFIRKNFEDFSRTHDFLSLSHSHVKALLSEDDLVVSTEEVAFEAIMRWVRFSSSERQVALPDLLTEIRIIYLPLPYLVNRVETEELIINSKPCQDLVNKVKNCHLMPEMMVEFGSPGIRPRYCFMPSLYACCVNDVPDCNSDSRRLFIFTLFNNKWLPVACTDLMDCVRNVVAVNGKIYVLLDKTISTFDPAKHKWDRLEAAGEDTEGAAVVVYESKIYCFGSVEGDNRGKMRVFDTQSNEWSVRKKMKMCRSYAAGASLGEFIYVTGGYGDDCETPNRVERYNPSSDQWTDIPPMFIKRQNHSCASLTGKIYVCGCVIHSTSPCSAEVYDPHINQWKHIRPMRNWKIVVSLVPHNGGMYAFGKTDIEVYESETDEWKSCFFVPMEVRGAASISICGIQNGILAKLEPNVKRVRRL